MPGLDPSRLDARRFSQGLFTRTGGGLRPVHVTLPEARKEPPSYKVGEPLLGLPKLVVLSALAQAEVDAAANDGNGAEDDEEGRSPIPNPNPNPSPNQARRTTRRKTSLPTRAWLTGRSPLPPSASRRRRASRPRAPPRPR